MKKAANVSRDRRTAMALRRLGYRVITIWECELSDEARVMRRIRAIAKASRRLNHKAPEV
jgi:DNA mismatch endonuclease (patch repair protein)